jgi:hypothetical protein
MKTVITYTPVGNNVAKPQTLLEPPHIDDTEWPETLMAITHRFRPELQNTFLVDGVIIAVWKTGLYMGIVERS